MIFKRQIYIKSLGYQEKKVKKKREIFISRLTSS